MPAANVIDLTVSIVSHGHGPLVSALLADLAALPGPKPRVILTLNIPETDIVVPNAAELDVTIIVNPTPKGFGANHNAAFALNTSGWFGIVNPDIRLLTPPFERMMGAADPSVALVAPRVLSPEGREEDSVRANMTPWSLFLRHFVRRRIVDLSGFRWMAGMFLLVRAEAFAAVGGFDSRLFLYCEDYELSVRLSLAGYRFALVRDVAVVHHAQRANRRSPRHIYWHLASLARIWPSRTFLWFTFRNLLNPKVFALKVQDMSTADDNA